MGYNIYNPFDEWEKEQERMIKVSQERLEELNNSCIWEDGEAPMDYAKRIEEKLNNTVPALEKMVEVLKAQAEDIKSISESALSQSKSAEKIANQSNAHSWVAIGVSVCALLLELLINWNDILTMLLV